MLGFGEAIGANTDRGFLNTHGSTHLTFTLYQAAAQTHGLLVTNIETSNICSMINFNATKATRTIHQ